MQTKRMPDLDIKFPALTDSQKAELDFLKNRDKNLIDLSDIPEMTPEQLSQFRRHNRVDDENKQWIESSGENFWRKLNAVLLWARMNGCPINQVS